MKNKVVSTELDEVVKPFFTQHRCRLAQLVEHQTFNRRFMGSNPISGSITCASSFSNLSNSKSKKKWCRPVSTDRISAEIAQLGERQTEDLKVPGSIPVFGNTIHYGKTNTPKIYTVM